MSNTSRCLKNLFPGGTACSQAVFRSHPSSITHRSSLRRQCRARSRGFTLIEGLLAAAILGVATVAVVGPVMTSRQQTAAIAGASESLALARQLLEEIAARPYADPDDGNILLGPDFMESSREWFDNVDDYHGYTDTTDALQNLGGTSVKVSPDNARLYTRRVTVEYRAGPAGPTVAAGDFALVRVRVGPKDAAQAKSQEGVQLSLLVTRVSLRK